MQIEKVSYHTDLDFSKESHYYVFLSAALRYLILNVKAKSRDSHRALLKALNDLRRNEERHNLIAYSKDSKSLQSIHLKVEDIKNLSFIQFNYQTAYKVYLLIKFNEYFRSVEFYLRTSWNHMQIHFI